MPKLLNQIQYFSKIAPNRSALCFGSEKISYGQLNDEINRLELQLTQIPKESFVGLVVQQPMTTMVLYLALLKHDCVPCVIDVRWSQKQIDQIVAQYGIPYLINDELEVTSTNTAQHLLEWHHDLLHIGFTSGTTGLPKAYYRGERSWIASYEATEILMKDTVHTLIGPGPLSHSLSLFVCVFALYSGRSFIGQKQFDGRLLLEAIGQEPQDNTSALFVVPTMLVACFDAHKAIQKLHYVFTTGDKLSSQVREKVYKYFPHALLIEFFGTSEASFISYNYHNEAPAASVGKPFPNVEIQLEQQDSQGIGQLNIRSDMTFSGYVMDEFSKNDWISVGDFASIDQQDYLYLHGRQHDRMIIGGRNVYPHEIESVAKAYPEIDEVVVLSEPHSKFGEIAVLLYVGKTKIAYKEMSAFFSKHLARYQIPSKIIKIQQMSYTQSGKIARHTMKQRYMKGEF